MSTTAIKTARASMLDIEATARRTGDNRRIAQRPLSARGPGQRSLPDRAGSPEVPLPGNPGTGPRRQGRARWAMRWKPALNAFAITFEGRIN